MKKIILLTLLLLVLQVKAQAKLHGIFSDNMVLQHNVRIPIFGFSDGAMPIKITFVGKIKMAKVVNGKWKVVAKESIKSFSAVSYYFANRLEIELNIPVGLIGSYYGGAKIDKWMPEKILKSDEKLITILDYYRTFTEEYPIRKEEIDKKFIRERLALQALKNNYYKNIVADRPSVKDMTIEGNKIRLSFNNTGSGLIIKRVLLDTHQLTENELLGFAICRDDKIFVWADTEITSGQVIVSSPKVANPVAVRYGWDNFPLCNVYNKKRLSAVPFRTDNFKK